MNKKLSIQFRKIRRYILPEGLSQVEKAFIEYGEYCHDKNLRNNKKLIKTFTDSLHNEFMRIKTNGDIKSNKKSLFLIK